MITQLSYIHSTNFPTFPTIHVHQIETFKLSRSLIGKMACQYRVTEFEGRPPAYVADKFECAIYLRNRCTEPKDFISTFHGSARTIVLPQMHPDIAAQIAALYYRNLVIFKEKCTLPFQIQYSTESIRTSKKTVLIGLRKSDQQTLPLYQAFRINVKSLVLEEKSVILAHRSKFPISDELAYSLAMAIYRSNPHVISVTYERAENVPMEFSRKREADYYTNQIVWRMRQLYFPSPFLFKTAYFGVNELQCPLLSAMASFTLQRNDEMTACPLFLRKLILKTLRAVQGPHIAKVVEHVDIYLRLHKDAFLENFGLQNIGLNGCKSASDISVCLLDECCYQRLIVPIYARCEYVFGLIRLEISGSWVLALEEGFEVRKSTLQVVKALLYQSNILINNESELLAVLPTSHVNLMLNKGGFSVENDYWCTVESEFSMHLQELAQISD